MLLMPVKKVLNLLEISRVSLFIAVCFCPMLFPLCHLMVTYQVGSNSRWIFSSMLSSSFVLSGERMGCIM